MSKRERYTKVFSKPSRTQQSFKEACDINLIMKRFKKVMNVEYLTRFNGYVGGQFGDFSNVVDYRSAIEQVSNANEVFMKLPAVVRSKFMNDPAQFLDFCHDPKNADELVQMGLATAKPSEPVIDPIDKASK